jgi:uncharacterized membrane protein
MSLGLAIIIAGVVTFFVSFAIVCLNLHRYMISQDPFPKIENWFRTHILSLLVMALGILLVFFGLACAGAEIVNRLLK